MLLGGKRGAKSNGDLSQLEPMPPAAEARCDGYRWLAMCGWRAPAALVRAPGSGRIRNFARRSSKWPSSWRRAAGGWAGGPQRARDPFRAQRKELKASKEEAEARLVRHWGPGTRRVGERDVHPGAERALVGATEGPSLSTGPSPVHDSRVEGPRCEAVELLTREGLEPADTFAPNPEISNAAMQKAQKSAEKRRAAVEVALL